MIKNWIEYTPVFNERNIMFMLDNLPNHLAKLTTKHMQTSKFKYLFLPGYSPQLSPVELAFNTFKKRLNRESWDKSINLNKLEAFKIVNSTLSSLTKNEIKNYFGNLYAEVRNYLDSSL